MASVGVGVDASSVVSDVTSALDPGSSPAASPTGPGSTPQPSSGGSGSGDPAPSTGDSTTPTTTPDTTTTTTTNDPTTTTNTSQQTTSTTTTSTHETDTTTSTSTKTVSASPTSTTTTTAVTHTSTTSSSSAPSASPSHTASTITSTSTSTQTSTATSTDTSSSTSSATQSNAFMPISSASSITTFSLGEHSILTTTTLVTTNADGVVTTMTSVFPTLAPYAPSSSTTPSTRTAIIGGTTAGAIVLIIAVCVAVFVRKSRSRKKWDLLEFVRNKHRAQRSRADLLAGEDFDDDPFSASMPPSAVGPMMRGPSPGAAYGAGGLGYSGYYHDRSGSPSPSIPASGHGSGTGILMRPRASESGSVFHESVWPPPAKESRFVDPITGNGSHVDLGSIVDDIMGGGDHSSEGHGSMLGGDGGGDGATAHARTPSAGTVSAGGHTRDHSGSPLLGTMPLRSSPLASRSASLAGGGAAGAIPRPSTPSTPTIAESRVAAGGRITPISSSRSATPNWLSRSPAR